MKKLLDVSASPLATPVGIIMVALLTLTFWFAAGPSGHAQDPNCTVCHKRTQSLTFPCNSLEYRRHLDHGDTMNACQVTPVENL